MFYKFLKEKDKCFIYSIPDTQLYPKQDEKNGILGDAGKTEYCGVIPKITEKVSFLHFFWESTSTASSAILWSSMGMEYGVWSDLQILF
jgi:hypothetical protein